MPIEFRCTECDKLLRTPDETAGKQAKCPECGEITQIPVATPAPPPDAASGSPFSSDIPPPDEATDQENPFQSPTDYTVTAGEMWPAGTPELRAYAMTRVSGPAVALIVTGALGLTFQVLGMVANIAGLAMGGAGRAQDMMPLALSGGVNIATGAIGIVLSILVIMGGMKMKNLESYGLSMTAAIVAMVPCISPCCLLGLPFGIWALVALLDVQVKAAFASRPLG